MINPAGLGLFWLDGHTPVPCDNVLEWAAHFEQSWKDGSRQVARTVLPNGMLISTVFLGINHAFGFGPPVLFETMAFSNIPEVKEIFGKLVTIHADTYQDRYCTWEEAEEGHKRAVYLAEQVSYQPQLEPEIKKE